MPQSFSAVAVHLVFSTKDRRPFFQGIPLRESLHAYLGRISKEMDCPPLLVGCVEDHVHLLCQLGRSVSQADWVKELKRVSNAWVKAQGDAYAAFQWQGGYAAFGVSHSDIDRVKKYIAEQARHHQKLTFQDELRALLRRHEMEWDERYVWD